MTVTLAAAPDGAAESLAVDLTGTGLTTTGYDPVAGVLSVTGNGSLATYQGALHKVTYAHAPGATTAGPRTVTVVVTDGTNASLVRTAVGSVTALPPKVSSIVINGGQAQRSRVTSLTVNFDQAVNLPVNPASAFQLVRSSDNVGVTLAANMTSNPTNTVTLSFTGGAVDNSSLADGRYNLTILAAQVSSTSGALDGNGDGIGGDDYTMVGNPATNTLFRLFGDADGNGSVDGIDFGAFRAAFGTNNSVFDFDNGGAVDGVDFGQFRQRFGTSI
jgi:hypothetical protein